MLGALATIVETRSVQLKGLRTAIFVGSGAADVAKHFLAANLVAWGTVIAVPDPLPAASAPGEPADAPPSYRLHCDPLQVGVGPNAVIDFGLDTAATLDLLQRNNVYADIIVYLSGEAGKSSELEKEQVCPPSLC